MSETSKEHLVQEELNIEVDTKASANRFVPRNEAEEALYLEHPDYFDRMAGKELPENPTTQDILGEEPVSYTPEGAPIYPPEETDYSLRQRIQQESHQNASVENTPQTKKPARSFKGKKRKSSFSSYPSYPDQKEDLDQHLRKYRR